MSQAKTTRSRAVPSKKTASKAPAKSVRPKAAAVGKSEKEVSDVALVTFMARARTIAEIAKKFDLTTKATIARLRKGLGGYYVFNGPESVHGEKTFLAVPDSTEKIERLRQVWSWRQQKDGQPYGIVTFPMSFKPSKIRIVPIDAIHYGDPAHDKERFERLVETIATEENTFCFLNGDIISPIKGGKKEDRETLLLARTEMLLKLMMPIRNKILWAQQGCLEEQHEQRQGFDPLRYFCERLKVPYFTEPVYVDIFWGKMVFTIWAIHGHSSAQTKGGRANALRNPASIHQWTNFLIMGHIGDATWNREIKLTRDPQNEKLRQREEYKVTLGSFKRYLGTRAARRGHIPPSRESIVLYLYDNGRYHVKTRYSGPHHRHGNNDAAKVNKKAAQPKGRKKS